MEPSILRFFMEKSVGFGRRFPKRTETEKDEKTERNKKKEKRRMVSVVFFKYNEKKHRRFLVGESEKKKNDRNKNDFRLSIANTERRTKPFKFPTWYV